MASAKLNVNGKMIESKKLTINDLEWLYRDFMLKNGRVPNTNDGLAKNNLPQQRIISKIMKDNNLSYSDFVSKLGKRSHVRSDIRFYNEYVEKFISIYKDKKLQTSDLMNNEYGLPSASWLISNCPDSNVKTYGDFVRWCGLEYADKRISKEFVDNKLIELQSKIGDIPITQSLIKSEDLGFSMIVIKRLYGTLSNAKIQLGLNTDKYKQPTTSFEDYKKKIDYVLDNTKDKFITWKYIESYKIPFSNRNICHKSIVKSFRENGMDFYAYLKSRGYCMNQNLFSSKYIFDDGEKVLSTFEYTYSTFLKNELNLKYNIDYKRDVMYKTMLNAPNKKINCDYIINDCYIEIAGIINPKTENWRVENYPSKIENEYRNKMLEKELILKNNKCNYIFLFPNDFEDDRYKTKTYNLLNKH